MKGPGGRGEVEVAVSGVVGKNILSLDSFCEWPVFSEHKPVMITDKPLFLPKKEKLAFIAEAHDYLQKFNYIDVKMFWGSTLWLGKVSLHTHDNPYAENIFFMVFWLVLWSSCSRMIGNRKWMIYAKILWNIESGSPISDQSQQDSGPLSPVASRRESGIGSIVRKAASVASVAAKHAYAAAGATTPTSFDEEMVPLKCCLMSISLPWEHIAHDLLFKVKS